jgi:hypothetical protein
MVFRLTALSLLALAIASAAPLPGSATSMSTMKMSMKHQCRDKKGHFIKGTYMKCPAGTHKA